MLQPVYHIRWGVRNTVLEGWEVGRLEGWKNGRCRGMGGVPTSGHCEERVTLQRGGRRSIYKGQKQKKFLLTYRKGLCELLFCRALTVSHSLDDGPRLPRLIRQTPRWSGPTGLVLGSIFAFGIDGRRSGRVRAIHLSELVSRSGPTHKILEPPCRVFSQSLDLHRSASPWNSPGSSAWERTRR